MTRVFLFVFFTSMFSFGASDVQTVESVDLSRYLGRWYQIAAIPQFFQRNCTSNTVAEYSVAEEDRIQVYNSCTNKDGERIASTGRAKVVDTNTNAKLKVTFLKVGMWLYLFGGNYWILELDPNYRWAVVGEKTRKYGWILARDPSLTFQETKAIGEKIKAQGYELCSFITEIQDGGLGVRQPLCDYLKIQ